MLSQVVIKVDVNKENAAWFALSYKEKTGSSSFTKRKPLIHFWSTVPFHRHSTIKASMI